MEHRFAFGFVLILFWKGKFCLTQNTDINISKSINDPTIYRTLPSIKTGFASKYWLCLRNKMYAWGPIIGKYLDTLKSSIYKTLFDKILIINGNFHSIHSQTISPDSGETVPINKNINKKKTIFIYIKQHYYMKIITVKKKKKKAATREEIMERSREQ